MREAARARLAPRDAGDVYLLLYGGLPGNVGALLDTIRSQDKVPATFRRFTIQKDVASVCLRRRAGDEAMLVLSRNQISLQPDKYQVHQGDTNGGAIGPVVLAPPKLQWQAARAGKRRSSGRAARLPRKRPTQTTLRSQCSFIVCLSHFTKSSWKRSA